MILLSLSVLALHSSSAAPADEGNQYVGAKTCRPCHQHKKHNQYKIWKKSTHAGAFKTLKTARAREVAAGAGVQGAPEKAEACLRCHATGYKVAEKRLGKKFRVEDGVQCETCHHAGSGYKKIKTMREHAKAVAAGLYDFSSEGSVEALCLECHNDQSPTYKGFDFTAAWAEIEHDYPEKK